MATRGRRLGRYHCASRGGEPGALTGVAHSKQNLAPVGNCARGCST